MNTDSTHSKTGKVEWYHSKEVKIGNIKLSIQTLEELNYYSKNHRYQSHYYLIGDNILLIISKGQPGVADIQTAGTNLHRFLSEKALKKFHLIWDLSGTDWISLKNRKALKDVAIKNQIFLNNKYIILNGLQNITYKLFSIANKRFLTLPVRMNSSYEALRDIISRTDKYRDKFVDAGVLQDGEAALYEQKITGSRYSDDLLLQESRNNLLEFISHANWNDHELPDLDNLNADDPMYEVYEALYVLQRDQKEKVLELREINKNLELKVAERIVDIIDKESNLRAILDNSDSVIWLINSRYELIDFNNAYAQKIKSKVGREPLKHDHVLKFHGEMSEIWQERYDKALQGYSGVYIDQGYNNNTKVYEVKVFPIKEVGKIKGVSVFVNDISDLKKSELKLISRNKDLKKVNAELDNFVYRVSHDLRAPLTSILGLINLLKIEQDPIRRNEYIEMQERSVKKLDTFINDIINLSRNARQDLQLQKIKIKEIIYQIISELSYADGSKDVKVEIEVNDDCELISDKSRLSVILNNLISNSYKYRNVYIDESWIRIKAEINQASLHLEISDNGIGVDEKHINHVFEMFYRANFKSTGSGLGLYIVKETVEKLGGKVKFKSQSGQGTTVQVIIPNYTSITI
ncbi:MAG: PAS domain-containing sensor histidine kinase [Cyclobacteriaceae bacterium]|nr:PAS domain-containing sensor histidine kinase [Cyclobacteriaceae bacterium]